MAEHVGAGGGIATGAGAGAGTGGDGAASSAAAIVGLGSRRRDGRLLNQLRPFTAEQGLINRADGSAKLSAGGSSVIVGVYGPMKPRAARLERADAAVVTVTVKSTDGTASTVAVPVRSLGVGA